TLGEKVRPSYHRRHETFGSRPRRRQDACCTALSLSDFSPRWIIGRALGGVVRKGRRRFGGGAARRGARTLVLRHERHRSGRSARARRRDDGGPGGGDRDGSTCPVASGADGKTRG